MKSFDSIVIGGGIIGSTIAHCLAERGLHVAILEKKVIADGASHAAAGLLGVQAEWDEYDPLYEMARKSRTLFPNIAEKIRAKTGVDIGYEVKGIYRIANSKEEFERIQQIRSWQVSAGEEALLLSSEELRNFEPNVSSDVIGAVYYPTDGHVLAPALTKGQALSAAASGAEIFEYTTVQQIVIKDEKVVGVQTTEGFFSCKQVCIAMGAWSTPFLKLFNEESGTYPVKGEVISLKSNRPLLNAPIFLKRFYIAPKRYGKYVIGATMTPNSYQEDVKAMSVVDILQKAFSIVPALQDASWDRTWAGLRPEANGGRPYMEAHSTVQGLFVSTGYYRNGILLSPFVGEYMADLMVKNYVY
ncbi:glycine oxidase ThiO [Lysinibacillus mangiferihumi]|uniref:glycine oxidase n=1 Tax=Lysinibacillus mangiferihumi TaxID=1130819 RepID=A0A4V5TJA0_9BACI|nr:glycine oxidase ThiO [Lysinibacillus mangiferihumi]TKI52983.1 glycine oxidase ThiO [Lysinibacillus mangiferihumi]